MNPNKVEWEKPFATVTVFCFACGEEKFRPEIYKHGHRKDGRCWYVCRTCMAAYIEKNKAEPTPGKLNSWMDTSMGFQKQGRFGIPTDASLKARKKRAPWV